jgi:hypothetical protein
VSLVIDHVTKRFGDVLAVDDLEKLRALVRKGLPDAEPRSSGARHYEKNGKQVCALAAFTEYVAINFFAPPAVLVDPDKKLEGSGKGNRMLKVRSAADIDSASIQRWLDAAVVSKG